jgi:hypothetical protein
MKCYLRSHKDRNPIYRMTFSKCVCLRVYVAQLCPDGKLIIRQLSEVNVNTRFVTKLMPVLFKEAAPIVLYCCLSCANYGKCSEDKKEGVCCALFEGITPYLPALIEGSDMNGTPVDINVGRHSRCPR